MRTKTSAGVVDGGTLPFTPYLCARATRAGVRVTAPSHLAGPDTRRVSLVGRPFVRQNFAFGNTRSLRSPIEACAHEISLLTIGIFGVKHLLDATVEEECELTANMYFARPQKIDIRATRDTPRRDEAKPILYVRMGDAMDNVKY